jgi:hypothetical protein
MRRPHVLAAFCRFSFSHVACAGRELNPYRRNHSCVAFFKVGRGTDVNLPMKSVFSRNT